MSENQLATGDEGGEIKVTPVVECFSLVPYPRSLASWLSPREREREGGGWGLGNEPEREEGTREEGRVKEREEGEGRWYTGRSSGKEWNLRRRLEVGEGMCVGGGGGG